MNCSIFSNWWTLKIPRVSFPCDPASFLKQVDNPQYLRGNSSGLMISSLWSAAKVCSAVAIKYRSSPSTLYKVSSNSPSSDVSAATSPFTKKGV